MGLGFYDRFILPRLIGCACGAKPIAKQRAKIVPQARGVVIDMGFGSGSNLAFLDASRVSKVIAVEPSKAMLDWQRDQRRSDIIVEEVVAGAEATGLPDACADTILFTYALCTIPDAPAALAEAHRLLKPDGQILFCEHGRAPDIKTARTQTFIEPVWKAIAGGCHLTRNTQGMLEAGGFVCEEVQTMYLPGTPRFAGYNVWGRAHA
ncbi:ubiquinone/menaquinone biosynthesis C-methyltransferase UbiE [Candidatus Phycosocius bacilliformis]|uniref:Ubiquinone/menaquinone biosynthesis C-methyltransferase UbiE n=1 Tax=Candidatus Phycosocius bacilliformis TaxID=1445552 RepID=A0A2P2EAL9_9PROT|nr:class I SAM-dependent methyltransferase [Candidatus Phycosocius bacilliformis]GBF58117.1 ubiquinone/menaquinone biosynthesis C-methyltransferase UbiE [Candidatus Phycosocius bacilliformis]